MVKSCPVLQFSLDFLSVRSLDLPASDRSVSSHLVYCNISNNNNALMLLAEVTPFRLALRARAHPFGARLACRFATGSLPEYLVGLNDLCGGECTYRNKFREGLSNCQIEMMSAWTIKYTLKVSLKTSCQLSIYMVVISAKYSFISLLLHFN